MNIKKHRTYIFILSFWTVHMFAADDQSYSSRINFFRASLWPSLVGLTSFRIFQQPALFPSFARIGVPAMPSFSSVLFGCARYTTHPLVSGLMYFRRHYIFATPADFQRSHEHIAQLWTEGLGKIDEKIGQIKETAKEKLCECTSQLGDLKRQADNLYTLQDEQHANILQKIDGKTQEIGALQNLLDKNTQILSNIGVSLTRSQDGLNTNKGLAEKYAALIEISGQENQKTARLIDQLLNQRSGSKLLTH